MDVMFVALLLPLAVLALACALERFEYRVCGDVPSSHRRSRLRPVPSAPAAPAGPSDLDGPTLRLVRGRAPRTTPDAVPALRQAS